MRKNSKQYFIFCLLIVIFTIPLAKKSFENDTFFTIAIGNNIINNGFTTDEKLVWHNGLKFEHSGEFDVIIATIYNHLGFCGIYCFTILLTCIIGLVLFSTLIKSGNNILLSFFITLISLSFCKDFFCARAQIISYLGFVIEIYFIETLLKTQQKRYCFGLAVISIIIANFHSSTWPMCLILYLPYFAEYIFKKLKLDKNSDKLVAESFNLRYLLISLFTSFIVAILNPVGIAPYTDMIKVLTGISKSFIGELTGSNIINNYGMFINLGIFVSLLYSNKVHFKVSDFCMFCGIYLMGLIAHRNTAFLYLLCTFTIARTLTNIENFSVNIDEITHHFITNKYIIFFISLFIIQISIINLEKKINTPYIIEKKYPIYATEFILKEIDIDKMHIFNHFNFGSYLEFKGIPAFIDSRSGVFSREFNDTSILEDWYKSINGETDYKEIFKKYNITHALLYKDELISQYIDDDTNYNMIYEDDYFVLYEKKKNDSIPLKSIFNQKTQKL